MSTPIKTKLVKVRAEGCSPSSLDLFKGKDQVKFVRGDAKAPGTVHVDSEGLFGTTLCEVGVDAESARAYAPLTPGNYTIGLTEATAREAGGKGAVQVLCLAPSGAMGVGGTGTIKVTR